MSTVLSALWEKYLPLMRDRLAALDMAREAADRGPLSEEQRALALDAAHKFAGSLGMFGFPEGTDAARSIEHLLLEEGTLNAMRLGSLVAELHRVLPL